MTRRLKILVHYNGNWLPKKQSDTYSGNDLQFVVLPDKYTLEDVKRKVTGLHGFSQGPDFNIYGLVHVGVLDLKKRLLIADEDSLTSYVEEALRLPSFFVVQSEKGRVHGTPTTPSTSLRCPQVMTPLTPPTDRRMSSSDNDDSNSERFNGDGIGADNVPKAKIRLVQPDDQPSPMKFPRLHDAPSTPAPNTGISPPPVVEQRVCYELCVGKRFKTKGSLRIAIGMNRIVKGWEHLGVKTNPQVLSIKCKDPECKWTMTAKKDGISYLVGNHSHGTFTQLS
ncbi:hypothetical protein MKW94_012740 [Papaver nudicaule]|uniref:Uncharacterized protein n=1 Tax=Papaver nudicaule TaxID=74823 RepID=A0AA41UYP0_PAPNU|nr:hypothetical protein [Papaver nudicaule]